MENMDEKILSEIEAAQFLGVSRMTLLRWRDAGKIGFYRAGWRVLYSVENHLRPFLDACALKAAKEVSDKQNKKAASFPAAA